MIYTVLDNESLHDIFPQKIFTFKISFNPGLDTSLQKVIFVQNRWIMESTKFHVPFTELENLKRI